MEQLLISNAVDRTLSRVDFSPLGGRKVYLDSTYLDCVDEKYIVASTRARILQAGAKLLPKKENADIVVELRSGAVGTDQSEIYLGIPEMSIPGPFPISLPEVKFWTRSSQTGTAKLGLVAYDISSHEIIGKAGTIVARSTDNNSYFLGIGPWQSGTVRSAVQRQLGTPGWYPLPDSIAFTVPSEEAKQLRLAGSGHSSEQHSTEATDQQGTIQTASGESLAPPNEAESTEGKDEREDASENEPGTASVDSSS